MRTVVRRPIRATVPDHDAELERLPRRTRRRWLNWPSAVLLCALAGAVGLYAGVRIEKGQVTGASGSLPALVGSRASAGGTAASRLGAGAGAGASGLLARAGGRAGGGTVGTISSIRGRTVDVSSPTGNMVAVRLTGSTRVTKSVGVRRGALRPGDTVVVAGLTRAGGSMIAATVTDSGASTASSPTGQATVSSGASLGSLFSAPSGG